MSTIASTSIASSLASASGLNSGLPISDIISKLMALEKQPIASMQARQKTIQSQKTAYTSVQGKVNDLLVSMKKLTARDFSGNTLFNGMSATSSNSDTATASAAAGASAQTINLEVKSLPSSTKASSTGLVGKFDNSALLSDLGISDGSITMYVNNVAHIYTIDSTKTIGDVFNDINTDMGGVVTAGITSGKVTLGYTGGGATSIQLGSGADTSNFFNKLYLSTATNNGIDTITASQGRTTFTSSMTLSDAATAAALNTPITDGTFSINGVSFDTTGKTLSTLMSEINQSAAKVTASFNSATNKFELVSKDTGNALIGLSDGTGNFLTAMKLINGADTTSSQTLGTNAEFVVNGVTMFSTSTTADETVTGLTGITLNLKQAQPGTTFQVTVSQDNSSIVNAVKDVITKYNAVMTAIDTQTDSTSDTALLKGDNRLKTLRNNIRTLMTAQISGGVTGLDSFGQVGISTGAIGAGVASKGSPQLQLDETKLTTALNSNPAAVMKLFIGRDLTGSNDGGLGDDNMEGTLTKIQHLLSDQIFTDGTGGYGALYAGTDDSNRGLFASYQSSAQKRIDSLNESIRRAQDRLATKEARLRKQYEAMDKLVGQYNTQGTAISNMISAMNK